MRIQTRLFLGTAALVLALMGLQWWLYSRQLQGIEDELSHVATSIGKGVLTAEMSILGGEIHHEGDTVWVESLHHTTVAPDVGLEDGGDHEATVDLVVIPTSPDEEIVEPTTRKVMRRVVEPGGTEIIEERFQWVIEGELAEGDAAKVDGAEESSSATERRKLRAIDGIPVRTRRKLEVTVEGGEQRHDRYLVVTGDETDVHRIKIPVSPTVKRVRSTMREGAAVGGVLLIAGLFASAVLSRRLTSPLRALSQGAEALGHGDLGVQVPITGTGEVGDLQRSFNHMSQRLAELEAERGLWQQREHLAQLGDLSRGLAHTLRNPLHTLGLAVEELADGNSGQQELVTTARAQIRRIDQWLRSFLALGAEESVEPEEVELAEIVKDVVLETVQQGSNVRVEDNGGELPVAVVPGAVRAALANLIENAAEVSPPGEPVVVRMELDRDQAVVTVIDRGPGLPDEVRQRLYSPHVTTKVGGSGMGLFLARQLVVGMHGGELEIDDGENGGTVAVVRLPLAAAFDEDGNIGGE
jgi:signal transduction histidine kinase